VSVRWPPVRSRFASRVSGAICVVCGLASTIRQVPLTANPCRKSVRSGAMHARAVSFERSDVSGSVCVWASRCDRPSRQYGATATKGGGSVSRVHAPCDGTPDRFRSTFAATRPRLDPPLPHRRTLEGSPPATARASGARGAQRSEHRVLRTTPSRDCHDARTRSCESRCGGGAFTTARGRRPTINGPARFGARRSASDRGVVAAAFQLAPRGPRV
jgi:hypothetical protein